MKATRRRKGFQWFLGGRSHSALSAVLGFHFERLRIGITLVDGHGWHVVHSVRQSTDIERERGLEDDRGRYNTRCLNQAADSGEAVVGEHRGSFDLFVPVIRGGEVRSMLVSGPFRRSALKSVELLQHWRDMTGEHGYLGDPGFSAYVSKWLGMRELDASGFATYRQLVQVLAELIASERDAEALSLELNALLAGVTRVAMVDQMWEAAREMTAPPTTANLSSRYATAQRVELRLFGVPEYALVGLMAGRSEETDLVDEVIRRYEFQSACARLAHERGNVVCGPVGDHGVVFLIVPERSEARSRARLIDLGERARQLARREFGLKLHCGLSLEGPKASLPERYQHSLAAAEQALSSGTRLVEASAPETHSKSRRVSGRWEHSLRDARTELGQRPTGTSIRLAARFERYLALVAAHCGYRIESTAAHLESGFERLCAPFLASGALDAATYDTLYRELETATKSAATFDDLAVAYRRSVVDLEQAVKRPAAAHQDRNLRRAVTFTREHVAEPLTLSQVARIAGFAPAYFSRLFKQRERVTFERYLTERRIARAKRLLSLTSLSTARVAQLSGFSSSQYFHRVFKRDTGKTPLGFRKGLEA